MCIISSLSKNTLNKFRDLQRQMSPTLNNGGDSFEATLDLEAA